MRYLLRLVLEIKVILDPVGDQSRHIFHASVPHELVRRNNTRTLVEELYISYCVIPLKKVARLFNVLDDPTIHSSRNMDTSRISMTQQYAAAQ